MRAGVLEQRTVDLLTEAGVADRLHREGMVHEGVELRFGGRGHRIDLSELDRRPHDHGLRPAGGRQGPDRRAAGVGPATLRFEVVRRVGRGPGVDRPAVRFTHDGDEASCAATSIAGCDGFHGVCRPAIASALRVFEREYPFAWLGILARATPVLRGADLREPRPRLRAAQHALARGHALLPPGRARRGPRGVARRARLGGAADALRARRGLQPQRGRDLRQGRHADALVRRRADAARPPLPRRRRRPHRPADRREGAQPRGRRRRGARARRCESFYGSGDTTRARRRTRSAACAASGACSTSRGG